MRSMAIPTKGVVNPNNLGWASLEEEFRTLLGEVDPDAIHFHNYHMRQYAMYAMAFMGAVGAPGRPGQGSGPPGGSSRGER